MKNGFTVVELALVLIIVGMLTGAVLVARSMVSSAKLTGFVSQIQKYDAAVTNFRTSYKYLPGDSPAFGGTGDGAVWGSSRDDSLTLEIQNAWKHMSDAGMVDKTYSATTNRGTPGIDVPKALYGTGEGIGVYMVSFHDDLGSMMGVVVGTPFFYVCCTDPTTTTGLCGLNSNNPANSTFLPLEALSIDKKIDDGLPREGDVRAGSDDRWQSYPTSDCAVSGAYLSHSSLRSCALAIRIGIATASES